MPRTISGKLKPSERREWIARRLEDWPNSTTNVLDSDFVDAYVEATGAGERIKLWGANGCSQLGRDLSAMAKDGILRRSRASLGEGAIGQGFPAWVYVYKLGGR